MLRAWRGLLVFLSRWFQIESLYKFNAKFQPRWEPRFVVYRASGDLPRIGFAAMQAEGFVTLALPLPRFLRRRSAPAAPCAHAVAERETVTGGVAASARQDRRRHPGPAPPRTARATRPAARPRGRSGPAPRPRHGSLLGLG